jgi:lipopolysaccharide/colanic/teichoic acid biosynthesis glycosyltransferase
MKNFKSFLIYLDIASLYLALVLAVIFRGIFHDRDVQTMSEWLSAHTVIFIPSLLFSLLAIYIAGLYDTKNLYEKSKVIPLLIYTQVSVAAFSIIYFYILRTELTPKLTLFLYIIFSIIILSSLRLLALNLLSKNNKQKALFIGSDINNLNILASKLEAIHSPYKLENYILKDDELFSKVEKYNAIIYDEELLYLDGSDRYNIQNLILLEKLKNLKIDVYSYTQYYEFIYKKVDLDNFDYGKFISSTADRKEDVGHYVFRRFIDLSCSLIILPFFILSIPFVYLLNLFFNKGSLFSIQDRVGYLGERVWLYKLRTMLQTDLGGVAATNDDKDHKLGNIITAFGKFLRISRLDELPQVINLIRDEISMIGPRADIIGVYTDMCREVNDYKLRLTVPQGLTGWAQVHMNKQPRTQIGYMERLAYEIYYIRNRSILLDISIILKTIKTVLAREGA